MRGVQPSFCCWFRARHPRVRSPRPLHRARPAPHAVLCSPLLCTSLSCPVGPSGPADLCSVQTGVPRLVCLHQRRVASGNCGPKPHLPAAWLSSRRPGKQGGRECRPVTDLAHHPHQILRHSHVHPPERRHRGSRGRAPRHVHTAGEWPRDAGSVAWSPHHLHGSMSSGSGAEGIWDHAQPTRVPSSKTL